MNLKKFDCPKKRLAFCLCFFFLVGLTKAATRCMLGKNKQV